VRGNQIRSGDPINRKKTEREGRDPVKQNSHNKIYGWRGDIIRRSSVPVRRAAPIAQRYRYKVGIGAMKTPGKEGEGRRREGEGRV